MYPCFSWLTSRKCDGGRPNCENCIKSKRVCTGYHRSHAFVLTKDVALGPSETLSPEDTESGLVLISRWNTNHAKPTTPVARKTRAPRSPPNTALIQPLFSPSLQREQLFNRFITHHSAVTDQQWAPRERHWLLEIQNLPTWTPSLRHAVVAASMARLGHHDGDVDCVRNSLSFYTKSLGELRKAIVTPAAYSNDQHLATLLLLLQYEVYECPGNTGRGYLSHYNGYMQLLRLRGPKSHRSGLAHSVFRAFRLHCVSYTNPRDAGKNGDS
jgi:hypothetical protein